VSTILELEEEDMVEVEVELVVASLKPSLGRNLIQKREEGGKSKLRLTLELF